MNKIDLDYQNLVRDILENGTKKSDRTLTGTISVFGRTIRHSMKDGFPLLTTKKIAFKTMVTELLWFLKGDTNIKYLVDNGCHIWDGDAYKNYLFTSEWLPISGVGGGFIGTKANSDEIMNQDLFINKIKTDDEFAKTWGELGPIYGKQWRNWKIGERKLRWSQLSEEQKLTVSKEVLENTHPDVAFFADERGIDQIANVINLLKTDPDSRRMIVNAWNVADLPAMVLPPCHMMFQFYTRELSLNERDEIFSKKTFISTKGSFAEQNNTLADYLDKEGIPRRAISLRWDQRSVDVGLGLPFNIASYALLLEIIAKEVNMIPEEVIGDLGDCHIYNNHVEGLKEQLTRVPYELPTIKIEDEVVWADHDCLPSYSIKDFTIENYQSHPSIKLPLSN
jgi:thymidylate synthase